jgi:hypothetical protein
MKKKITDIFSSFKKTVKIAVVCHLVLLLVLTIFTILKFINLKYPNTDTSLSQTHTLDYFFLKRDTYVVDHNFQEYLKNFYYPKVMKRENSLYDFFNPTISGRIPIVYSRDEFKDLMNLIFHDRFDHTEDFFLTVFQKLFIIYVLILAPLIIKLLRIIQIYWMKFRPSGWKV